MTTYLFYLAISFLAVFFLGLYSNVCRSDYSHKNSMKVLFLSLSFLSLFIPLILRDISVGTDYTSYRDTFISIINSGKIDDNTIMWLGWPFIYFIKTIAPLVLNNYVVFYGLISLVSLLFLYASILKSRIPWLSLALFIGFCLYFQMFNQIRQLLAICIILYSLKHIRSRSLIKFYMTILVAGMIHTTALLFLPFYFLSRLKITKKTLTAYLIIGVLTAMSFSSILSLVALTSYGQIYLPSGFNTSFAPSAILNFAVRVAMLVFCLALSKKVLEESNNKYLYNLVIYCTILQAVTIFSSLFGRITTIFFVFYILLIPEVIVANFKNKGRAFIVSLIVMVLIVYQYIYYTSPNGSVSGGYGTYKTMDLSTGENL